MGFRECIEVKITWVHLVVAFAIAAALFAVGFFAGIISESPTLKYLGLN